MTLDRRLIFRCFLLGAMLTGAAALQSCSEDVYPDNPGTGNGAEGGGTVKYFSMRLLTADSEAVESDHDFTFDDGNGFEHAMDVSGESENVVIFFDTDWNYTGYSHIDYDGMYSQGGTPSYPSEASYIGVIHSPDPEEIYSLPEIGILVLNAENISTALDRLGETDSPRIDDVLRLLDEADESEDGRRPGISGNGHLTMTSTAYLEPDNGSWKHSLAFRLDRNKIYDNRQQAVNSPATTAIVERMAAKVSLSIPGGTGTDGRTFRPDGGRAQVIVCHYTDGQPNYNNRTWTLSVDAWGINKYEPAAYYFRDIIGEGADTSVYPYTYGADINTTGKPFYNGWNRASYHRALWGKDPHYEDGIFPRQYRPAVDNRELEYYGSKGKPSLGFVSYNQLSTDFSGLGTEKGTYLYTSENTFPDTRAGGLWQHNIAASELVVGARIHINTIDETKADYDLFRNRIGIFYPSLGDFATYFISTFNSQLTSQSSMTFRYYDWADPSNNGSTEMHSITLPHANYRLYYGNEPLTPERMAALPKIAMPALIENGDGKVIPWVEGMYIGRREVDPDTYEEIGNVQRLQISDNDFKSLIYDWIGAFDHFNKGRMVYCVPILHKASVEKVSAQTYRPTVGDYGVVRNTWYSLALQAINKMGSPVDDLDQKIIPYESSLENSVLMEIKVLDWHEFSTTVTLPDKLK